MAMQAETETVGKLDRTYTDPGEATFLEVIPIVMVS